ncbi:MAG: hypothetical protein IJO56_05890 [Oscillospiraceae bacterium]|nr:hypothetical protein [Oscillospiraceae bacterium]
MATQQLDLQLVADVKTHLNITWSDPDTDRKVEIYIRSGMTYLDGKLGESADYTQDGTPRTLLFEYCRYMRDGALDVFEPNYLSMILAMQNDRKVRAYAAENAV